MSGSWLALGLLVTGLQSTPDTLARVAAEERPRSTATAVTILLPRGSGADPEGKAGASWLLAHTLSEQANGGIAPGMGRVTPTVGRGRTGFTLLAPRDGWEADLEVLLEVVFRTSPDPEILERVREDLLDRLRFEADAPVRRFQQEVDNLVHGSAHPWSRPVRGTPASVRAVTPADLEILRRNYRAAEAVAAVVGPGPAEVEAALPASPPPADPDRAAWPAWEAGDRLVLSREVTNSWVAVAYPLAPDLSRTRADFLRFAIEETLVSTPPDPGLFGARVRIESTEDGPVLLVSAAVSPEEARRWEDRILEVVSSLAREPEGPAFFHLQRRRFRSSALLARGVPERASRELARGLLRRGSSPDPAREIEGLGPEDLRRAAAGLGPARILLLGPDLSLEEPE